MPGTSTAVKRRPRAMIIRRVVEFYERGGKPGWGEDIGCLYCIDENPQQRCAFGCQLPINTAIALSKQVVGDVNDIYYKRHGAIVLKSGTLDLVDTEEQKRALQSDLFNALPSDCTDIEGVAFWSRLQTCHDHSADHPNFLDCFKGALSIEFAGEFNTDRYKEFEPLAAGHGYGFPSSLKEN